MARELECVFDDFLYASKKFQSNGFTSSLVYPAISYLKNNLVKNIQTQKYTKEIRQELVKSLCKRFGAQLNNDIYLFATYTYRRKNSFRILEGKTGEMGNSSKNC